ncbi:uncharacterized protein TNCV_779531 [Trichonephila clavipes]|nr:uncharacterized protein TNCV_779531 [Trichonephila clavipes]
MSLIKALNRKMGTILIQLTKLSSKPLENLMELELRTVLDTLLEIKEKFETIKQAYFRIDNDEEFKNVETLLNKTDEDIKEFQLSGKLLLFKFTEANKFKEDNNSSENANVLLPEIPLPQFDGQFSNWSSFKSQFHNLIQNNPKLSDSQKLFYLNASLKSAAKQVQSSNDTYDSLLIALTLRYENTKLIVDSHIQSIISYKPLVKENSAELRLLIDTLQRNIHSLEALKFELEGLNSATVTVGQQVSTVLSSKNNEFVTDIEFLMVPKITDLTASQQLDIDYIQLPKGITLADAQFFEPSKIDILLGAKTFFEILKPKIFSYCTTCAPFLATRTLLQLSEDEKQNFPLASPIVKNDFYVDYVLSGAPDLETAIEIQQQLIRMMNACGMHLYKWCSNSCHLLSKVSTDDREYVVGNDDHTSVKALGLS